MLRNIVIGVVVLLAVLVGVAFVLPQAPRVERATVIGVAPQEIFAIVNDHTRFNEWSPWAALDPKTTYTIDGPPAGAGSRMTWRSDKENVGSGSMEIVESVPFSRVKSKLDFGGSQAVSEFVIAPTDGGTRVTWSFETDVGYNPFMRYMGLFFDAWVGKDYESGLSRLKQIAEKEGLEATKAALAVPGQGGEPPDEPLPTDADPKRGPEIVTLRARAMIVTRSSAKASDDAAISASLGAAYQKILNYAQANELEISGAPLAITIANPSTGNWVFDAAVPLADDTPPKIAEADGAKIEMGYAGRAVKLTHKGPYSTIGASLERLHAFTKEKGLKEKPLVWEEYVSDPGETLDEDLLTNLYVAVE